MFFLGPKHFLNDFYTYKSHNTYMDKYIVKHAHDEESAIYNTSFIPFSSSVVVTFFPVCSISVKNGILLTDRNTGIANSAAISPILRVWRLEDSQLSRHSPNLSKSMRNKVHTYI